jgi:hypothetical protein
VDVDADHAAVAVAVDAPPGVVAWIGVGNPLQSGVRARRRREAVHVGVRPVNEEVEVGPAMDAGGQEEEASDELGTTTAAMLRREEVAPLALYRHGREN